MSETHAPQTVSVLAAVSNAMVTLHKEQFGRGPTRAHTNWAGEDSLICVMQDALLPAERALVEMGEGHRVQETRMYFQSASADTFIASVEAITGRRVWSFASATDARMGVVTEIYHFEPRGETDGHRPTKLPVT